MTKNNKHITKKPWNANHKKLYSMLHTFIKTQIKEADKDNFIEIYKRKLMSMIENNNKWADSSKEGILFMCARWLYNNNDMHYSKLYSEAGFKYMKQTREKENENQQDDKEIENYRDRPYFLKILNSINYNDIKTIEAHYKYLILALLTLQPPIRTSFYTTAQFITLDKEDNKKDNFIRIDRRGTLKCYYIISPCFLLIRNFLITRGWWKNPLDFVKIWLS